jgi:hypothetical protein
VLGELVDRHNFNILPPLNNAGTFRLLQFVLHVFPFSKGPIVLNVAVRIRCSCHTCYPYVDVSHLSKFSIRNQLQMVPSPGPVWAVFKGC